MDHRFTQSVYTQSMAKLLEHMNRVDSIQQRLHDDQDEQEVLKCKFINRVDSDNQPWFSGFSFSKKNDDEEKNVTQIQQPDTGVTSMLVLDSSSLEELLCSFLNENALQQPDQQANTIVNAAQSSIIIDQTKSSPLARSHKRTRAESSSDFDDLQDVKRLRFDQQFQEVMQQKSIEQNSFATDSWNYAPVLIDSTFFALPQPMSQGIESPQSKLSMFTELDSFGGSADSLPSWNESRDVSPTAESATYRYLVRSSRAKRKNNTPLPQEAFQMSFKFRS